MRYDSILYEEQGEIGLLTLNMPEKRNALGIHAEREITECLQDAAKRHDTKVIILRANGPVFCAGHERTEIQGTSRLAISAGFSRRHSTS